MEEKNMSTIYCNSSNIGKLLEEINIGLEIGNEIKLKIILDKSMSLYYGYFVYYGFQIINIIEIGKKVIVDISKQKTIGDICDKKYSWLIKLPRTGIYGKRIYVYKFRTMQPYAEYIQDFVINTNGLNNDGTIKNDFRITKVGRFLRRYWLDELPMILNLLKGDLKLIGFRPLSDVMLNTYPKNFVKIRNRYKPGLIPPYYIDKPKNFDGLIESEERYIKQYISRGSITDVIYFCKFINALLFKGVRSS
jgi:lipopolysaccharide/colanic/teichoic acid biosynthesis glycosyltransferase